MDRDDIFRLLMVVLLLANRELGSGDDFSYSDINEFLILALFIKPFCAEDDDTLPSPDTTF